MEDYGKKMRKARKAARITQTDMAKKCGVSPTAIHFAESGGTRVSIPLLLGYCEVLSMTPDEILEIRDYGDNKKLIEMFESLDDKYKKILMNIAEMLCKESKNQ